MTSHICSQYWLMPRTGFSQYSRILDLFWHLEASLNETDNVLETMSMPLCEDHYTGSKAVSRPTWYNRSTKTNVYRSDVFSKWLSANREITRLSAEDSNDKTKWLGNALYSHMPLSWLFRHLHNYFRGWLYLRYCRLQLCPMLCCVVLMCTDGVLCCTALYCCAML